jgi:hypothetical protein
MKIVVDMMDLRLRASPRHGGSGGTLSNFFVTEPPHKEALSGAAALLIISDGPTADNRLIITEYYDFYRKIQKNLNARRSFTPTALCSPKKMRDYHLNRKYVIIMLSAGTVLGDRHGPLPHRTTAYSFILSGDECRDSGADRKSPGNTFPPKDPSVTLSGA